MCGIVGKVSAVAARPVVPEVIKAMAATIAHRGPDDEGFFFEPTVGLGMRRLSVIDVAGGHQPIANEDETVWVVCNGEIYNFHELRERLTARGHRFKTKSDVEVIVHLYEDRGAEALADLRGMFALAIWDVPRQRLFLARDRVGKKPLCYAHTPNGLVFGSEIKALLKDPEIIREVDVDGLDLYLSFQFVPAPRTMFRGISKLPPGHYLVWERGAVTVHCYWRIPEGTCTLSSGEAEERFLELLTESVRLRLVSDVPIGAFLSGGLDSAVVVGLMSKLLAEPVRTFTIGFEEAAYNELPLARVAADGFKTSHREYVVRPNVIELLPKLVWHYDEPLADKSAIPTYYLCREAARDVKVVLSGDGGDELLAGYPKYRAAAQSYAHGKFSQFLERRWGSQTLRSLWGGNDSALRHQIRRKFFRTLFPASGSVYYSEFFDGQMKRRLLNPSVRARISDHGIRQVTEVWENARRVSPSVLDAMLRVDAAWYLPGDLLPKMDIASMAHGLEVRSPFLDHTLVEFAFSLPSSYKVAGGETKRLLKRAAGSFVAHAILTRGKMGFSLPLKEWFRNELKDLVYRVLLESGSAIDAYFDRGTIERLIRGHVSGRENHAFRLWALMLFVLWHHRFIEAREDILDAVA
jgi:asparagine synthase (glutamine-hydrolysing)